MSESTHSASTAVGTVVRGESIPEQDVEAVVKVLRDVRTRAHQQPRHQRCDVSEEEFERSHALVQGEKFWS
jgi:hypothetical protein